MTNELTNAQTRTGNIYGEDIVFVAKNSLVVFLLAEVGENVVLVTSSFIKIFIFLKRNWNFLINFNIGIIKTV